ncbi:4-alpha-glucanotransferase [Endozoicomonadaceae bacterium StTr2]
MSNQDLINQLASLNGIAADYIDAAGQPVHIAESTKIPIIEALGFDIGTEKKLERAIEQSLLRDWSHLLPPVCVVHQGKPFEIPVCIPETRLNNTFRGELVLESKKSAGISVKVSELPVLERRVIKKKNMLRLSLEMPEDLPLGYHKLSLRNRNLEADCYLIVTPPTCHEPDFLKPDDKDRAEKIWGCSIQLYTLRSETNWGIGDFSDLKYLAEQLGNQGADVIGLNPIHSLYPSNPQHCSPYSPSSKNFINPLYIDVTRVPDYGSLDAVNALVNDSTFQQHLKDARETGLVDYEAVAALKFPVLEALYSYFESYHAKEKTPVYKEFDKYRRKRGIALDAAATYDALYEFFREDDINSWGWPCWPDDYQQFDTAKVKSFQRKYKSRIRYFMYLQWLAESQLAEVQQAALDAGMRLGIYRDLAVGVDRGGADVWCQPDGYCLNACIGAPPDPVAPQGQNWGLPPLHPAELKHLKYAAFIETVQSNMSSCGALRIDHVMGLFRLWWCPAGATADQGVYVTYPLDDLLGILKLESLRRECLVFGEDLGTVPDEIEQRLPPALCYSNEVVLFSRDDDHFFHPDDFKARALTCVSNHDIPTLKAWWNCDDLDLRQQLGIYDAQKTQQEKNARHEDKIALLKTLQQIGECPWGMDPDDISTMGYSRDLMEKIHYYLAKTASTIVTVQLEDIQQLTEPVNVPGTSDEYPNWRRKQQLTLSAIFSDDANRAFFRNLTLTRQA